MVQSIIHLFPPTLHPMVIHFTIAIIYLAALAGLLGLIIRRGSFFAKAFFGLLILGVLATLAAGFAGVVSESYVHPSPDVAHMLSIHKRDGELTGVLLVIALFVQAVRLHRGWKISWIAFVFCLAATTMVSITGYIGGSMVYDHGLGVHVMQHAAR